MELKPNSKHSVGVNLKAPNSGDATVNNSLVSRIDQALDDDKNRREQLSRRPSYRKILKELGGSKPVSTNDVPVGDENEDGEDGLSDNESPAGARADAPSGKQLSTSKLAAASSLSAGTNGHSPALRNARSPAAGSSGNGTGTGNTPQSSPFTSHDAVNSAQLSNALTSPHFVGLIPAGLNMNMVQVEGASQHLGTLLASAAQPAAILQYAQQGLDGQLYIPAANVQAYQMAAASANSTFGVGTSQPLFVATAPSGSTSGGSSTSPIGAAHGGGDDTTRKREMRLLKNREAARECRRKKKEYVKCLENRVAVLESQNKTLIEELKSLKDMYCSKDMVPGAVGAGPVSGSHS